MARVRIFFAIALISALVAIVQSQGVRQNAARIPMDSLKTLYFKDGHKTLSRRNKKFPQLQCTGNSRHICDTYGPDVVLCRHLGDGAWKCEADLHHSVRFGNVDVSCEGWEGPHDEYVLRGSCMLKYTLLPNYADRGSTFPPPNKWKTGVNWEPILFYGVIIAIFLYFWLNGRAEQGSGNRTTGRRPGGGGGGGGGGGDGGYNDAPPPYMPYPKQEPGTSPPPSSSANWRPGFWTGLAGGALASEAARYMRSGDQQQQRQRPGFFGGRSNYFDDDNGYGGGGGGNMFGPAGSSRSAGSDSGGESRRAYGYGGSSVR